MSLSPVANRSFLHGDRKPSPNSEKIVYATLDSLALKRATLPLKLLPVDDRNESKRKGETCNDTAARRSSFKVDATANSNASKERAKYVLVVPSPKPEEGSSRSSEESSALEGTIIREEVEKADIICLLNGTDADNDIEVSSMKVVTEPNVEYHGNDVHGVSYPPSTKLLSNDSSCEENTTFRNSGSKSDCRVFQIEEDDYEKIEFPCCGEGGSNVSVSEKQASKQVNDDGDKKAEALHSISLLAEEKLGNDLTRKSSSESRLDVEKRLIETLTEELLNNGREDNRGKKKAHFAKNVLHFVPEYLVKGSKRRKKKQSALSSSLNSLKVSSVERKIGESESLGTSNARYRSRSLSRDEVKCLNISSPTNFVHVASATSPNLISNENTVKPNLEQAVITHEQKCATLPLLVTRSDTLLSVSVSVSVFDMSSSRSPNVGKDNESKETARKEETLKRELLSELRARSAKMLEQSQQQAKTSKDRACEPEGSDSLRTNASFLWSNQIKSLLENTQFELQRSKANENTADQYDDVGPLNLISQEDDYEDDYDDVGLATVLVDEATCENSDSIYDDVATPICSNELRNDRRTNESTRENDDDYQMFPGNEYSSVEEEDTGDDVQDNDQGVYDDVGFPGEERVNSLYAGSTTGSILGSIWTNGKESEWEDLEESTVGLPRIGRNNNSSGKSTDAQMICNKKKSSHRWSRKTRRQCPRVSKRSASKSSNKSMRNSSTQDNASDDSTYESLRSFQQDDSSTDSEPETNNTDDKFDKDEKIPDRFVIEYMEAPTRPTPPPPREISLTRNLGRRIKMLRRTWSITKGSLGRMRRRTSVDVHSDDHSCEENKESSFGFARHFKKSVTGLSTFYLNGYTENGDNDSTKISNNRFPVDERSINSNEETDRYSVLAEQEPLYQFYAAAAARGAFDSNSDGYEEVEDMIPSQSTTDLAKPGHRTLWCQTPQVLNSDLLQRLTVEEKKIQEAKFEIITSEASYLNSLRVLRDEFLNEPSISEILTPLEREKLFGGIPSVLQASEQCLAKLETIWRQDPMLHGLPDVLLSYADKSLDIYVAYCSNQVSIDSTLKDLRTRKGLKFLDIVSQVEARSTCQSLSLHSFLMLPMQRITRLPLLADAVLSKLPIEHVDRPQWERVLSSLSYVVAECNEGARAAAKEAEMESLARKLEYSAKIKPIELKGKHLVKTGAVVQLSSKADAEYKLTFGRKFTKTHLYLFLLTDHLLVAKYKFNAHDASYTVVDTCKRSLIALESVPEDSPFAGRNAMLLTLLENYAGHQVEYILTCESNTERQRWLEAVSPSKRGLMEETLYEAWDCPQVVALYCYSPNQPDELSLHPGDVINVFRKMSDGWYHGEKLLGGEQGWFPGNFTKEVASEHVRARNLKQRHRLLALNGNLLQRKTKQPTAY